MDHRQGQDRCPDKGASLLTGLAMLSFAAPWMAWGALAAVGLPVLAHLLSRTRYKPTVFPAARWVRQAVAIASRVESPRQRWLMLLRILTLALLVLAFMRPKWVPQALGEGDDTGITLIVLIDASASMNRVDFGVTLYDRALREADLLIRALDPVRDAAAVVRVDHAPAALLPEPTAQLSYLRERLQSTAAGYTHADWAGALAVTQQLIADDARQVRLVTLSDQQGEPPILSLPGLSGLQVDHLPVPGPVENVSVRLVDLRPYPAIENQPMLATVQVDHFGDEPVDDDLIVQWAGQTTRERVALLPGSSRRVDIRLPAATGRGGLLQVRWPVSDAIVSDNATGAWLPMRSGLDVMVVHEPTDRSAALAKRLALLINPGEVAGMTLPNVLIRPMDEALATLMTRDVATLRTVVLLSDAGLPDALSRGLEAYAQRGGGVIQFVSSTSPAELGDPVKTSLARGVDFELEPLRIFEGAARQGLSALRWPGVSDAWMDDRATALLVDEDARVIVGVLPRGRGRLIAINALLSADPGGLLSEPAFAVLFHELCRYASPGQVLPAALLPGEAYPVDLKDATRLELPPGAETFDTFFTRPGPYVALDSAGQIAAFSWVQLDPSESDTRVGEAWGGAYDSARGATGTPESAADTLARSLHRDGIEWWPAMVLAALGLIACESVLLWYFASHPSGKGVAA